MRPQVAALVLAVSLVAGASGCGSQREQYCEALKADQAKLGDVVNSGRPDALIDALPLLRSLADEAPDDLTDEWQTFVNAVAGLRAAVKKAGLTSARLRQGIPGDLPADDKAAIKAAADRLTSEDVVQAAQGIETQGRDVCKVNIGV